MIHQNQIIVKTYSIFFPCYPKGITWKTRKNIFWKMMLFWNTTQTRKEKPHWVRCLSIILKRNWNKSWTIFYKKMDEKKERSKWFASLVHVLLDLPSFSPPKKLLHSLQIQLLKHKNSYEVNESCTTFN